MICVTSAGNSGNDGIIAPADAYQVISVGAVDSNDELTWFSSRGPTADGRIKPEVCAQGLDTYAATPSYDQCSPSEYNKLLLSITMHLLGLQTNFVLSKYSIFKISVFFLIF